MAQAKRIGELLLDRGAITPAQLEEALLLQKRRDARICQLLMSMGYLTHETLLECLEDQAALAAHHIEPFVIDPALMSFVPREFAVEHEVLPLNRREDELTLAMAGSLQDATPKLLHQRTGFIVREVLCARTVVRNAIGQYYGFADMDQPPWDIGNGAGARLAVPNPSADLRAWGGAAQTHVGAEAVRLKNLLLIVESLDRFPVLPEVHLRVLERLDDPEVQLSSLQAIIQQDPLLSANVLRMANSAAFATHGGLDSIERAVVFLGVTQLRQLVLASAVFQHLSARAEFDLAHTFRVAYRCGLLTKIICEAAHFGDRDTAFTAGLLADLGQIALRLFSQEYVALIEASARATHVDSSYLQRTSSLVQLEEAILGASASELGYQLAGHWNLPRTLADTIRFHDRLDRTPAPPALACAVALARYCLTHDGMHGHFGDGEADPELAWLLGAIGASAALLPEIERRFRDAAAAMNAPVVATG